MKRVRLKAKRKCHCENHYLELCTSFDGERFIYHRYCYHCGKSWTYTDKLETKSVEIAADRIPAIRYGTYEEFREYIPNKSGEIFCCIDSYDTLVSAKTGRVLKLWR